MTTGTIKIVAALIRDDAGRVIRDHVLPLASTGRTAGNVR